MDPDTGNENTCIHTLLHKFPMKYFSTNMSSIGLLSFFHTWVLEHFCSYATLSPQLVLEHFLSPQIFPSHPWWSSFWNKSILLTQGPTLPCSSQNSLSLRFRGIISAFGALLSEFRTLKPKVHFPVWFF